MFSQRNCETVRNSSTNHSSVHQEYVKSGKPANSRMKCSRKSASDDRGRRRLVCVVETNRKSSLQPITSQFNEGTSIKICSKTIRRHMAQLGWGSRRPHSAPMSTAQHRMIYLQFTKVHRNWSMDNCKCVMWSDESRFTLYRVDGRQHMWRHGAMDHECHVGVLQSIGGGETVWAAFTWPGLGSLLPLQAFVIGCSYVQLLVYHLHPFIACLCPNQVPIFLQDNSPHHCPS